uniref:Uncharacterized protein n=1 Tax=Anguilla anguilla TaxID=7936 RepID=A0A0E9SBH1_ANGAN
MKFIVFAMTTVRVIHMRVFLSILPPPPPCVAQVGLISTMRHTWKS